MVTETEEKVETKTDAEKVDPFPDEKFDEVDPVEPAETDDKEPSDKKEGEEPDAEETGEVDVFLDGEKDFKPPKKNISRFKKRIDGLNERNAASNQRTEESNAQLAAANEKIRVYEQVLQQQKDGAPIVAPNAADFDEGTYSPEFIAKNNEYILATAREQSQEHTTQSFQQSRDANQAETGRQQKENARIKHYEGAHDLGAADFEKIEDTAIEVLGPQITDFIIDIVPGNSAKIMYYLGKRPHEAEALVNAAQGVNGPAKLTMALGVLADKVRTKPKGNIAPDPETEVEGGNISSQSLQAKYDNAIKGAMQGNNKAMTRMREISKHARENNITLKK